MAKYEATIHTENPFIIEVEAGSAAEAVEFIDSVHTGPAAVTIVELKGEVVAMLPEYKNTFREWTLVSTPSPASYADVVKMLWTIADGVGQRDSLDTFSQLMRVIKTLESR